MWNGPLGAKKSSFANLTPDFRPSAIRGRPMEGRTDEADTESRPTVFSNRHCQQLTSLRFVTRAGLQGSLRGRRAGRRMLAFKVG